MSKFTAQIISGLLFSHPVFEYSENKNGKKHLNVLIAGDTFSEDSDAKIVFNRVFNCGQMTEDYLLCITVASSDPEETEKLFNRLMPGLKTLKHLFSAEIKYDDIDQVNARNYGYIIAACEDKNKADELYGKFAEQIEGKKALLCILGCDTYSRIDNRDIYRFADEDIPEQNEILKLDDLNRYAYNCGLSYEQNEDERTPVKPLPDLSAKKGDKEAAFFSDNYGYSHSLSFVVHIPYKLKICADSVGSGTAGIGLLLDIIIGKNSDYQSAYNKLIYAEHRRWCADLISDGWNMPDDTQLQETFTNGNRQKISSLKLHPCLCEGNDKGCLLNEHYELWNECKDITTLNGVKKQISEKHSGLVLSELEMISLALYGITNQRVRTLCEETNNLDSLFEFAKTSQSDKNTQAVLGRLHKAANRLRDEIPNSASLYKITLNEARNIAKDNISDLEEIENKLEIIVERNKRKNYYTIDEAMIDMIPFMMWFGKEYRKVIIISSGLATEDVIAPTMLYPEEAVFIGDFVESDGYKKAIEEYFISRHVNTESNIRIKSEFVNADGDIGQKLCSELKKSGSDIPVVFISRGLDINDTLAVYSAVGSDVPLITYSDMHIKGLKNANKRFYSLLPKSFSVSEYANLLQSELKEDSKYKEYSEIPDDEQFNKLTELYEKYAVNKNYGKNKSHVWRNISQKACEKNMPAIKVFENGENKDLKSDKEEFIASLESSGFITVDETRETITFKDEKIRNIFNKQGEMLELLVYIKAKQSGLFNDVQQGQELSWDCQGRIHVKNEIDIILTNGLTPIFISCKDRAFKSDEAQKWLYEIHGVADHFNAVPVLVLTDETDEMPEYLSGDDNKTYYTTFKDRAKAMGISLLGRDTVFDEQKLFKAFEAIKAGKTVTGTSEQ